MNKLILSVLSLVAFNSFADSEQIPSDRKVTSISVYEEMAFVRFYPAFANSQGCPNGGNVTVTIDMANEKGKEMYSAVLAAATAGKTIGFGINGCNGDRPKAYRIDVNFD